MGGNGLRAGSALRPSWDMHQHSRSGCAPHRPRPASPLDDPWRDVLASGWEEARSSEGGGAASRNDLPATGRAAAYDAVHRGPEFQRVRRLHRRFVLPAAAAFLVCHLGHLAALTLVPDAMGARLGGGPATVALVAGLGQFAVTFLLTWAYARHARLRRDPAALELRWEAQRLTGAVR